MDNKMNICIVTEFFPHSDKLDIKGGVEVCAYNEATELSKYHDITILTSKDEEMDEFDIGNIHIIGCGDKHSYVQKGSFTNRLKFMKDAYEKGKQLEDIDLIIGYNFITYPIAQRIGNKLNIPVASRYHDVWVGKWVENIGMSGLFGEVLERHVLRNKMDLYVCVSDYTKNNLLKYVKNTQVETVHNMVDFPIVESDPYVNPTISCVARLVDYKRVEDLIRAIDIVKEKIPNIQCKIIGTGPLEEELKALTNTLNLEDNVEFLGFVEEHDDVMKVVNSSDIFCLPSIVEGFGIVIIEAQSLKTPFIAAEIPPVVESSGKKGGLFFKPKDYEDLSSQILRLLEDKQLYKQLQDEGFANTNNYTHKVIGEKLNNLYTNLIKDNR